MDNRNIADILYEIATFKELSGENSFKVRAYQNAARIVETYPESMEKVTVAQNLENIKGIGKSIAQVIEEIVSQGRSAELEDLKNAIPPGIPEMLGLQGMGPKKVIAVWKDLGITTIGGLENACREGRLSVLPGFGEKSQEKILKAIEFKKKSRGSFLYSEALTIADSIIKILADSGIFETVTIAGSLRRGKKIVNDADILVVPEKDAEETRIRDSLTGLADEDNGKKDIIGAGPAKVSIRVSGLQVDFRIIEKKSYPAGLQYFTGSKEHNTILRGKAKASGYKLNEYGIYKGEIAEDVRSEEDIYRLIGCAFIPPELREAQGEIEAAEKGMLPRLVEPEDIKGIMHVHSVFSDGAATIEELCRACAERGYEYLGVTDHSESARYAGGLTRDKLSAQAKEIARINKELAPFRVFFGIESDIRTDGSLDYEEEILSGFDFIIGSIHAKLTMDKNEATARLLAAISNPRLTVIGHVSGRLLLSRDGYPYDEDAVLDSLRKNGTALEHNCHPYRLDPDWEFLKKAAAMEIPIALGPDVHDVKGLDDVKYGVIMARKAWCTKTNVLNCMSREEIDEFFEQRKKRKSK